MHAEKNCSDLARRVPPGRLRSLCLRRGWDFGELARRAGVSRTTLYHLDRGVTGRPHLATLGRIAAALELSPAELDESVAGTEEPACGRTEVVPADDAARCAFDRSTNPAVAEVCTEHPALFRDWSPDDWDELYSTFGTGGQLTPDGVREAAESINRKRQVIQQLQVVLETHLADVAANMVATLYRMVDAGESADGSIHSGSGSSE